MKNILLIIVLSVVLTGCNEKQKAEVKIKKPYDESYIVVFDHYKHNKDYTDSTHISLNAREINEVDLILKKAVEDYNNHPERYFALRNHKPVDLKLEEYKRQYSLSINNKGEKEVWVSCVHNHFAQGDSWKRRIVIACGGGDNFFNVLINLSNHKFYDFRPNGPA